MKRIILLFVLLFSLLHAELQAQSAKDSSRHYWISIGGNSSIHLFSETPAGYEMKNLFSKGIEMNLGFRSNKVSIALGYRYHLFVFKQYMSPWDAMNGYGISTKYEYLIETIPLKIGAFNRYSGNNHLGVDVGVGLSRGNFKKITVEKAPGVFQEYVPDESNPHFEVLSTSVGLLYDRKLMKGLYAGVSMELQYELVKNYSFGRRSQMQPRGDFEYPYDYIRLYPLGSVFIRHDF